MTETWEYGEAAAPAAGFPWPPPEGESAVGALGATWKSATFDPRGFFTRMPKMGGSGAAILYYLIIGVLVSGVNLLWEVLPRFTGRAVEDRVSDLPLEALDPVASFLLSPLMLLLALVMAAGITHLLLRLFGGARHGFATTVRVFCFAYSPMIFGVVPRLGAIVGTLWMLVLAVIGLREAHESEGWQPVLAVLVPFILLIGLVAFLVFVVLATGAELLLS